MIIKLSIDDLYNKEKSKYTEEQIQKLRSQFLLIEDFKKYEDWLKESKNVVALNYTMSFVTMAKNVSNVYQLFRCSDNSSLFENVINENVVPYLLDNDTTDNKDKLEISITKNGVSSLTFIDAEELSEDLKSLSIKDNYVFTSEVLSRIVKVLKSK